jgi:hypothetical protein
MVYYASSKAVATGPVTVRTTVTMNYWGYPGLVWVLFGSFIILRRKLNRSFRLLVTCGEILYI